MTILTKGRATALARMMKTDARSHAQCLTEIGKVFGFKTGSAMMKTLDVGTTPSVICEEQTGIPGLWVMDPYQGVPEEAREHKLHFRYLRPEFNATTPIDEYLKVIVYWKLFTRRQQPGSTVSYADYLDKKLGEDERNFGYDWWSVKYIARHMETDISRCADLIDAVTTLGAEGKERYPDPFPWILTVPRLASIRDLDFSDLVSEQFGNTLRDADKEIGEILHRTSTNQLCNNTLALIKIKHRFRSTIVQEFLRTQDEVNTYFDL